MSHWSGRETEKGKKQNIVYILVWNSKLFPPWPANWVGHQKEYLINLPGKGKVWHCSWRGWHHSHPCTAWGRAPSTRRPAWATCRCGRYHAVSLKIENIIRVTKHGEQVVWMLSFEGCQGCPAHTQSPHSRLRGPVWLMKNSNCNLSGPTPLTDTKLCVTQDTTR